jgi:hypothetical protein
MYSYFLLIISYISGVGDFLIGLQSKESFFFLGIIGSFSILVLRGIIDKNFWG